MQQLDYWLYSGTKVTKIYGRIFKIQTYLNGQGRPRGELFVTNHGLYYYWMIPLYLKNRRANLPKVGAQDVQRSNRKQRESLCGWHVSEKHNKKVKHLTDLTVAIKAYPLNWFHRRVHYHKGQSKFNRTRGTYMKTWNKYLIHTNCHVIH